MEDRRRELRRMVPYLGWDISEHELEDAVLRKESGRANSGNFNTGRSQGHRSEMAPSEIEATTVAFELFLAAHRHDIGSG